MNATHDPGTHSKSKKGFTLPGQIRLRDPRMHVDAEVHAMGGKTHRGRAPLQRFAFGRDP